MVEILIGPELIKRLWRKIFPKKVKTIVTTELDTSEVQTPKDNITIN